LEVLVDTGHLHLLIMGLPVLQMLVAVAVEQGAVVMEATAAPALSSWNTKHHHRQCLRLRDRVSSLFLRVLLLLTTLLLAVEPVVEEITLPLQELEVPAVAVPVDFVRELD
jgi:hypothetical protein